MDFAVRVEAATGDPVAVEYRWDVDTDILTARLDETSTAPDGVSGSVELEGADGSWLVFDVRKGRISGVEVAVWPDVHKNGGLVAPPSIEAACVVVPLTPGPSGQGTLEVEAPVRAEADEAERLIFFRIGPKRQVRTLRLARDLLLDVDSRGRVAGLWLLDVPPFPTPDPPHP